MSSADGESKTYLPVLGSRKRLSSGVVKNVTGLANPVTPEVDPLRLSEPHAAPMKVGITWLLMVPSGALKLPFRLSP
jgi:hypothetical protein